MADNGEPSAGPKAIASLAKKQPDLTRQGSQKLKFVPTLPARRKKDEPKQETSQPSAQLSDKSDGKGRGKGRGRGGGGKGPAPPVEMTASGPFAMGPTIAGTSARRTAPRTNLAPIVPQGHVRGAALGATLSNLAAPTFKKEKQRENTHVDPSQPPKNESDGEVYSEPDEGVEIIDMDDVRQLDWMAPEALKKEQWNARLKREVEGNSLPSKGPTAEDDDTNALNLSGSEEENLEDLVLDFTMRANIAEERLYFFQFPEPFPTFISAPESSVEMDVDTPDPGPSTLKRKVSFATDVKPAASTSESANPEVTSKVDGVIGQMEVYRSGAVKMRLGNGIVLNVSEGTRSSFLQQGVHLDMENKKLRVLGKISKRFIVSPDLDTLLASMELADANATMFDDADLIKIDSV